MASRLRILLLSAEVAPFAKTGGLGDVAGALPKALAALGHDVRVVMPAYQAQERAARAGEGGFSPLPGALGVPAGAGLLQAGVFKTVLPGSDVPVYLIAERSHFDRPNIYGYDDDPYRFAFFSRAALELAASLGFRPDLVHAHDWHAAPAVMWLDTAGRRDGRFGDVQIHTAPCHPSRAAVLTARNAWQEISTNLKRDPAASAKQKPDRQASCRPARRPVRPQRTERFSERNSLATSGVQYCADGRIQANWSGVSQDKCFSCVPCQGHTM